MGQPKIDIHTSEPERLARLVRPISQWDDVPVFQDESAVRADDPGCGRVQLILPVTPTLRDGVEAQFYRNITKRLH